MSFTLDPELRKYASDAQWKKLEALAEYGSQRAAAKALGVAKTAIYSTKAAVLAKAAQHGYSPDHDMVHQLPDGYRLRGTSTLYDSKTGEPKIQWVKSEADKERQQEMFLEMVKGLSADLPRFEPIPFDRECYPHISRDLLACYPVGDHHLGMLAWDKETGENYDLKIGEALLAKAGDHLIATAPPCEQALVVFLGDFMHYDNMEPVTPTGRNQLDADGRFPKMVRVAVRAMRYLIEAAAVRHAKVRVIVEIGNHDLSSSIFLMECLNSIYENDPRIEIDTSPAHYHYFRFGQNLIGVHHGHGTKMQNLPLIMAHDRREWWGETLHRMWWTGHIHHSKTQAAVSAQDFTGCTVESFRVLGPEDAWAHQKGYRAKRSMKSIVLHREHGEVARNTFSPSMF
jgi:hypothetical protein